MSLVFTPRRCMGVPPSGLSGRSRVVWSSARKYRRFRTDRVPRDIMVRPPKRLGESTMVGRPRSGCRDSQATGRGSPSTVPDSLQHRGHRRPDRRPAPGTLRVRRGRSGRAGLLGAGRAARGDALASLPGDHCATSMRRRTRSRPPSSSWSARRDRSGCGTRWVPGSIRSPAARRPASGGPPPAGTGTSAVAPSWTRAATSRSGHRATPIVTRPSTRR